MPTVITTTWAMTMTARVQLRNTGARSTQGRGHMPPLIKTAGCIALALAAHLATAEPAPYAGQQKRAIKSLSDQDVTDLLQGQGMGLAKAAELNGYPGPAHVLEHADALALTDQQRTATTALLHAHKDAARKLGAALIASEEALDEAFKTGTIHPARLSALTGEIGQRQARLREEHLRTHLAQTALLHSDQIQRYSALRGYAAGSEPSPATRPAHKGHH